jgi:outer membrane protein assembly factor BamB
VRPFIVLSGIVLVVTACSGARSATTVRPANALRTLPDLQPPHLVVTHAAHGTAPGYLFVAEKGGKDKPSGAVIADDRGRIRWYHQVPHGLEMTDFRAQTLDGKPVLTWWQGTISKTGVGKGDYVICDAGYGNCRTLHAGHGLVGDLHEFQLTPRGTAFVSIYRTVPRDLRSVGGPKDGFVYDSVVQELDAHTGKVVWEWHSLDHVSLSESLQAHEEPAQHATKKRPLDYFHVNSVADAPAGRILVSGRNTSALYLIARDGQIVWRLGGKESDFKPAAAVKFRFQHNARFHGPSTISLFDNGAIPKLEPYTRPLVLHIDVATHRARIVKTFVHPQKISSPYEGDLQLLPSGGALVGWGGVPKVTEFSAAGRIRFELKLPYGDTYRAYRLPWSGKPTDGPRAAVVGDTVYASWNGDLQVERWRVTANGQTLATAPWRGLETAIPVQTSEKHLVVTALDGAGRTLASANVDR